MINIYLCHLSHAIRKKDRCTTVKDVRDIVNSLHARISLLLSADISKNDFFLQKILSGIPPE